MNDTNSVLSELLGQLGGAPTQQIASQLGVGSQEASSAIAAALPMLLGALGSNASQPSGAQSLFDALTRDHSRLANAAGGVDLGSLVGSVLGGLSGGAPAASARELNGGGILGHIFGEKQGRAEAGLEQASALNGNQSAQLLKILAPIVMAFLAKRVTAGGMNSGGLGSMLGQEREQVQQQGGVGGGLLNAVLDQNGDGKLDLGDLLKIGGSFLGGRR